MVCGLERRLSVMLSIPLALPTTVGEKVMLTEQFAPAAIEEPHVLVCENGLATLIDEIDSARPPVLLSVTVWAALVLPTF